MLFLIMQNQNNSNYYMHDTVNREHYQLYCMVVHSAVWDQFFRKTTYLRYERFVRITNQYVFYKLRMQAQYSPTCIARK